MINPVNCGIGRLKECIVKLKNCSSLKCKGCYIYNNNKIVKYMSINYYSMFLLQIGDNLMTPFIAINILSCLTAFKMYHKRCDIQSFNIAFYTCLFSNIL